MHWKQLPIDRNYLDDGYSLDEKINLNVFLAKDGNFEYFYVLVWLSLFVFNYSLEGTVGDRSVFAKVL